MAALELYINPTQKRPQKKASYSILNTSESGSKGRYIKSEMDFVDLFVRALSKWKSETAFSSSLDQILNNEGYKSIVMIGEPAIDLILDQLRLRPSLLVYALEDITGEEPYARGTTGNIPEMTSAWLSWGKNR